MSLNKIKEEALTYFSDASPSHDWNHVKRVKRNAEKILSKESGDREVVLLSVYLHDIGRSREDSGEIEDHASWSAEKAGEILSRHNYNRETINQVKHCIQAHRYSTSVEPETVEAEILCDADNLDAMGASGIARTFSYSGEHLRPLADPDLPLEQDDSEKGETALNHVHKKLLNLKSRMYTETGAKLSEDRHEFMEVFVKQIEREMEEEK